MPPKSIWHDSYQKRQFDARVASRASAAALWITQYCLRILEPGVIFSQERIGRGGQTFPMLKLQTLASLEEPLDGKQAPNETAQAVRDLAFDELVQILHVSKDPNVPGPMSIIGPRPQLQSEIACTYEHYARRNRLDLFAKWHTAYYAMRPGIFGPDSFIDQTFDYGSPEYYDARVEGALWYYEHGSQEVDQALYSNVLSLGALRFYDSELAKTPVEC